MKGNKLVNYSYQINQKDVKEASFQSVNALKTMKKNQILTSILYPMLLFVYVFVTNQELLFYSIIYVVMVLSFYFYFYQLRTFNMVKVRRGKRGKWVEEKIVTLTKNQMIVATNGVEQMYDWEQIEKVYETKENIILYLTGKQLNFIVVKKPRNKDLSTETTQFFSFFKRKLQELN